MDYREIELFQNTLRVYASGKIEVKRFNRYVFYEKKTRTRSGYTQLGLNHEKKQKVYSVHRIVCYAFKDLDIENPAIHVDHINRNIKDNRVENLRPVTASQNQFNRSNTKGYCWHKQLKKWHARIRVNRKLIHLGYFEVEADAQQAYLNAKTIHHIL